MREELAPVNCMELAPVMVVPLSVRVDAVKAVPVHLVITFVAIPTVPETATVWAEEPLYVKVVIPVPCVKSFRTLLAVEANDAVPVKAPVKDPVKEPVMETPVAPLVATMLPVPFIAVVDKFPA